MLQSDSSALYRLVWHLIGSWFLKRSQN